MKVKFIEKNPDYESIGIRNLENCLELNCIYDAKYEPDGFFGGTEYTDSYEIDVFSYPADWFEVVDYQSPLQPSEWTTANDSMSSDR